MKLRTILVFSVLLTAVGLSFLTAAENAAPVQAAKPAFVPADQPDVKMKRDGSPDKGFIAKHEAFLKRGKEGPIGVLFLGDSITEGWTRAKDVWEKNYSSWKPANFGIGGDRTQHVLWRIANGELDGIDPKAVILMIGTNNSGDSAENITKGVLKIITELHAKLPKSKLLVLGIFPRGEDPKNPGVESLRKKLSTVNSALAKLDDGKQTRYLDIGAKFTGADGVISKEIMADFLHPTHKGYEIWAEAMQPLLSEMLK